MSGRFERQEKSQRKHPVKSSATPRFGTTPSNVITRRPEWKGPGFTKPKGPVKSSKQPVTKVKELEANIQAHFLPVELQQLLLNIFRDSFEIATDLERLTAVVQDVKGRLVQRDFKGAFEGAERLEAYAVRWSSAKALCYAAVLAELWGIMGWNDGKMKLLPGKIVSLGGGAAETIAVGGLLRYLYPHLIGTQVSASEDQAILSLEELRIASSTQQLDLLLVDNVAWQTVTEVLSQNLFKPPPLSKYASASARAANQALLASRDSDYVLRTSFQQSDILKLEGKKLKDTLRSFQSDHGRPVVITLFFTLNELYGLSNAKTTAFLLEMTDAVPVGSVLLVVDSPGSYSEAIIGSTKVNAATDGSDQGERSNASVSSPEADEPHPRRYPMIWLLEHVLLGSLGGTRKGNEEESDHSEDDQTDVNSLKWEKVMGDETRLFRLDEKLKYPVKLENIRFQMHVFRRL